MIPILYENSETQFVSNGLGRLPDCISCEVTEERNGVFELTFEYPVNGANYENIQLGRIVAVTHEPSDDIQPFDIVSCSRPIDGVVTFFATHISYRLNGYIVWKSNITSLEDALTMFEEATPPNPFIFSADFISSGFMAAADGTPRTIREMLGGTEGSILDTYGGEFKFNRFNVEVLRNRGKESNLTIRYGLNLTEYDEDIDISESFSCVVPFWNSDKLIKGGLVRSGNTTMFGRDVAVPLDLTDKFDTAPTVAQLEAYALNYLNSRETHLPTQSINVDFVDLARSSEYKELAPLLEAQLCDTVEVVFPRYNMSGKFKVVKTEYDVLSARFLSMTLGTLSTNLSEALGISSVQQSTKMTIDSIIDRLDKIQFARGTTSLGNVAANSYVDRNVSFGKTFTSAPTVVVALQSTSTSPTMGAIDVCPINITTTGFTIRVFNSTSSQRSPAATWIATNID